MLELFTLFFKLGLFTVGGGVAMIPILRRSMVEDKRWFTDAEMVDILAVCQGLPGVIAINMATYVGFKRRGLLGSLVATTGVILPSFVIILLIARGMDVWMDNPYVQGAMGGLRAAALGLILVAVYQVAHTVIRDGHSAVAAVLSFVLIVFAHINVAWVILAYLLYGVLRAWIRLRRAGGDGS